MGFTALSTAVAAMQANQKLVSLTGENLANMNNPNYSRKVGGIQSLGEVGKGITRQSLGVSMAKIQSIKSESLNAQVVSELQKVSSWEAQEKKLADIEIAMGEYIDRSSDSSAISDLGNNLAPNGLAKAMDDFFNALQDVSTATADSTKRSALIEKATVMVNQFQSTDARLRALDSYISEEITSEVSAANIALQKVASLNEQISIAEGATGDEAMDLRDQRQAALEELSKYFDFTTNMPANADGGGLQVIVKQSPSGTPLTLVDGQKVSNAISFDGTNIQAGSPAVNLQMAGGVLNGLTSVRNGTLANATTTVDNIAKQFITSMNAAYGGNFFDANASNFNSQNIKLDASLTSSSLTLGSSGEASANDVALAMLALKDKKDFSTSGSPADYINGSLTGSYRNLITSVGQTLATAKQQLKNQSVVKDMLVNERQNVRGVSQDEELANLFLYQKAYQGSAMMIRVINEMLDTLVNGTIR